MLDREYIFEAMRNQRLLYLTSRGRPFNFPPSSKGGIRPNTSGGSDPSALAALVYTNHSTRVLADGGIIEDEARTKTYLETIIRAFSISSEDQFKSRFPATIDPEIFGYKVGTGTGPTLGFAASKLYSINATGDVVQATAANQPLLLRYSGEKYYYASRVTNNTISTASGAFTFTPATDELRLTVKLFAGAITASNESLAQLGSFCNFRYNSNGTTFSINFRGTANATGSSNYTPSQSAPHWVRLVINPSGASYFWSADGNTFNNIGNVALPTMGTPGNLVIGASATATVATKIYSAEYRNNTTAQVTTCNVNDYDRSIAETSWTGGGATWTINMDTGTTGLKGLVVDRTVVVGNGTSHKLSIASIALNQPNTNYVLMRRLGTGQISGRAASVGISHDATNITINNGSALNVANSGKIRQMLTAVYNGATSSMQVNDGVRTDGDSGSSNGTYLDILANNITYGNFVIEGYIISAGVDTEAQRTKMYNRFFLNVEDPEFDDSYFWGEENLVQWNAFKANPAQQFNMVFLGDSWIYTPYRFAQDIVAWAKGIYGNAGAGFVSAADQLPYVGGSVSRTAAAWVDTYDKENGIGINKTHSTTNTLNAQIVYTPTDGQTTSYDIFYIKKSGGGTFSYKIGSGSKTNVVTANATTEIGFVSVLGSQALTLEVENAGTTGVSIIGAVFKNANNGIRAHKVGMSGINAVQVPQGTVQYFYDQIIQLDADIVFILLGSNDMGGVHPLVSGQGMEDIAANIRAVLPNCDIVFCGSGSNGLADKPFTIDDYQRAYYAVAKEHNYTHVNLAHVTGNYTDANAAGYYEDNLHVNTAGGTLLANSVIAIL